MIHKMRLTKMFHKNYSKNETHKNVPQKGYTKIYYKNDSEHETHKNSSQNETP